MLTPSKILRSKDDCDQKSNAEHHRKRVSAKNLMCRQLWRYDVEETICNGDMKVADEYRGRL